MPHQGPIKFKIYTTNPLIHPQLVVPHEAVDKHYIRIRCHLCCEAEILFCQVIIFIQAVSLSSHYSNMILLGKGLYQALPVLSNLCKLALKMPHVSSLVPMFSQSISPLSHPWQLPRNKTFLFLLSNFMKILWLPCPFVSTNLDCAEQLSVCLFPGHWIHFPVELEKHHQSPRFWIFWCSPNIQISLFQVPDSSILLLVYIWHTVPWHAFICQILTDASTVYVEATVTIVTDQTICDPSVTSSTPPCKTVSHHYEYVCITALHLFTATLVWLQPSKRLFYLMHHSQLRIWTPQITTLYN
jgi:hypothetical protein